MTSISRSKDMPSWQELFFKLNIAQTHGKVLSALENVASYLTAREVRSSLIFFSAKISRKIKSFPPILRDFSFLIGEKNSALKAQGTAQIANNAKN